jgi:predicted nucleic acid-binding protein
MNRVLVDTSVWVAHFRARNEALVALLGLDRVLSHPMIVGELACGTPPARARTLGDIGLLAQAQRAGVGETMEFIERHQLYGLGCGLIDLMLLTSTLLTEGAQLWTLDQRLASLAARFGVLHQPVLH